jgi:transcriptional regulator with XRE-family HTH domain
MDTIWDRIERIARDRHGKPGYMVLQLAGVSSVTVQMLRNGYIPKRQDTRQRIAAALGVSEAELFQIADAGRD